MTDRSRTSARQKKAIFIANIALDYNREILLGAMSWANEHPDIRLYFSDNDPPSEFLRILRTGYDGVILGACDPALELPSKLARLGLPAVDTSGEVFPPPLPRVITNDEKVGKMAAEYFISRGFDRFAFIGFESFHWSKQREKGFDAVLTAQGLKAEKHHFLNLSGLSRIAEAERFCTALSRHTDSPIALFCGNDGIAAIMVETCLQAKLRVPEQIAILGVDDDHLYTRIRRPNISSVQLRPQQIGHKGMALLGTMLQTGSRLAAEVCTVPPGEIITRHSSDVIAVNDELIREAIAYIRNHLAEGVNVKALVYGLSVSRTKLEKRFAELLLRSPAEEIRRQRLEIAKHLLASTTMRIGEVASKSGFKSRQLFGEFFLRFAGTTPKKFREGARQDG